jgi:DNA-binding GntR family transcriptional regulator
MVAKAKRGNDSGILPPSAEERAYQYLRREILDGTYQPGERLREEALALQVGVSRTPVRGALQRLATEGLVEFRRYVGAVVRVLPLEEVEQVYQFRVVVESLAAELAAQRASEADIDRLSDLCQAMDRIAQREIPDLLEIARLNKEFHLTLLAAGGNIFVKRVAENLGDLNFMIRAYSRFSRSSLMRSMSHHRERVQALRARNPLWARSVMVAHIEAGRSANNEWGMTQGAAGQPSREALTSEAGPVATRREVAAE